MTRPFVAAALVLGAAVLWAQAPPAANAEFKVYLIGREIGREQISVTVDGGVRRIDSTLTFTERASQHTLTATLETALDGVPRRLVVKGDRPYEGRADLDQRSTPAEAAGKPFYFVEGGAPYSLQEFLIRYWRTFGRPKEFGAAPVGPIRIQSRAEAQLDLGKGSPVAIERLSVEGPVFGRETAWIEPGGNLLALVTWAGGLPVQVVRAGYETRMARFIDEALRDRLLDADRLTNQAPPEQADGVVLTGATVIVGGKRAPIPNATVVVRNGRIAEVGPSSRIKPPSELPKVDVTGTTIVPGLWDLHGQVSQTELLPVLLAAGTTTTLNFSPDTAFIAALRASYVDDHLVGPRMLTLGAYIDGSGTSTEDARAQVRKLRGDGVRILQVGVDAGSTARSAVAQEANRSAIQVAGWVWADQSNSVQVLDDGIDIVQLPLFGSPPDTALFTEVAKRQKRLEPMAAWAELFESSDRATVTHHPLLAGAPRGLVRRFTSLAGVRSYDAAGAAAALRAAQAAGVSFAVGTGEGVPGSQIVRELEMLVAAGMSGADALNLVTAGAAQLLKTDDAGTVEGGKRADLLILNGNPLDNIGNLRKIRFVVANGKVYDPAKLLKAVGWN